MLFLHDSPSMTREGQATEDACFLSVLFRLVLACYNPFRNRKRPNKHTTQNEDGGDKTELTYPWHGTIESDQIFTPSTVLDYTIETGRSMVHRFYICLSVLIDVTQALYIVTGSVHW